MIINSVRFYACIETCNAQINNWKLSLTVPKGDYIVLDGKVLNESARWTNRRDGKAIYIGQQTPIHLRLSIKAYPKKYVCRLMPIYLGWCFTSKKNLLVYTRVINRFCLHPTQNTQERTNRTAFYLSITLCTWTLMIYRNRPTVRNFSSKRYYILLVKWPIFSGQFVLSEWLETLKLLSVVFEVDTQSLLRWRGTQAHYVNIKLGYRCPLLLFAALALNTWMFSKGKVSRSNNSDR